MLGYSVVIVDIDAVDGDVGVGLGDQVEVRRVANGHSAYKQVVDVFDHYHVVAGGCGCVAVDGAAAGDLDIVPAADVDERVGRRGVPDLRAAGELKIDVAGDRKCVTEVGSGRDYHSAAMIRRVCGGI